MSDLALRRLRERDARVLAGERITYLNIEALQPTDLPGLPRLAVATRAASPFVTAEGWSYLEGLAQPVVQRGDVGVSR